MPIDIDQLTESELRNLNHRIVERLRFLSQMRAHSRMLEFRIGQRVQFGSEGVDEELIVGVLTRYNKKTVTVITDQGERWNVSPALLRSAETEPVKDSMPDASHLADTLKLSDHRSNSG